MASTIIGSGGVNRTLKDIYIGNGGVNRKLKELYVGSGGVNRKIYNSVSAGYTLTWSGNDGYLEFPHKNALSFEILDINNNFTSVSWGDSFNFVSNSQIQRVILQIGRLTSLATNKVAKVTVAIWKNNIKVGSYLVEGVAYSIGEVYVPFNDWTDNVQYHIERWKIEDGGQSS